MVEVEAKAAESLCHNRVVCIVSVIVVIQLIITFTGTVVSSIVVVVVTAIATDVFPSLSSSKRRLTEESKLLSVVTAAMLCICLNSH